MAKMANAGLGGGILPLYIYFAYKVYRQYFKVGYSKTTKDFRETFKINMRYAAHAST